MRGTIFLVLLVLWGTVVQASTVHYRVDFDTRTAVMLHEGFGFRGQGEFEVKIKEWKLGVLKSQRTAQKANFGVYFVPTAYDAVIQLANEKDQCPAGLVEKEQKLFDFVEVKNAESTHTDDDDDDAAAAAAAARRPYYHFNIPWEISGEWTLWFFNCEPDGIYSFDFEVSVFNINADDQSRSYVSAGMELVPRWMMLFLIIYLAMLIVWVGLCAKRRGSVHKVHHVMSLLLLFKAATVLCFAGLQFSIQKDGEKDGWNVAFYLFNGARGLLFFTVIILVGSGWSYMKPFLSDRDKTIIKIVIPIQVICNLAFVITREEGPAAKDFASWWDLLVLLDLASVILVVLPLWWQMRALREAGRSDGKALRNYQKLQLFRQFYVVVIAWVYFSRVIAFLLRNTLDFWLLWIPEVVKEGSNVAFYSYVGYIMRPREHNPYLSVEMSDFMPPEDSEDEEDARGGGKGGRDDPSRPLAHKVTRGSVAAVVSGATSPGRGKH